MGKNNRKDNNRNDESSSPSKDDDSNSTSSSSSSSTSSQIQVVKELKSLYYNRLLQIEQQYLFHKFFFPEILPPELEAKPTVLLIGQYSTGKTSFIRHLIGQDYPQIHIGPEPTTDRFVAVVHGEEEKNIDGNACTGISDLPFGGLSTFGSDFLKKFCAAVVDAPLLKNLNIIDTPGVLSGEKQRTSRGYDFAKVSRWFSDRADLILLMFDPSKLDISDEFRNVIEELQPNEDKVHCVLNKADSLDTESLMRVYGALLWSMGKVFKGAEVSRVYVGSFHDVPLAREDHSEIFRKDKEILLKRLSELPKSCAMRKVNEMVKRIRLCIVNVCILGHLRSQMPMLFGKNTAQQRLIDNLEDVFLTVRRDYQLAEGDFPKIDEFKAKLRMCDFYEFPFTNKETLMSLQDMLSVDIPRIISHIAGVVNEGPVFSSRDDKDNKKNRKSKQQPSMFKFNDSNDSNSFLSFAIIAALVVAIIALVVASVLDNHQSLSSLLVYLDSMIQRAIASAAVLKN